MKISDWSLFYLKVTLLNYKGYIMTNGRAIATDELESA